MLCSWEITAGRSVVALVMRHDFAEYPTACSEAYVLEEHQSIKTRMPFREAATKTFNQLLYSTMTD